MIHYKMCTVLNHFNISETNIFDNGELEGYAHWNTFANMIDISVRLKMVPIF